MSETPLNDEQKTQTEAVTRAVEGTDTELDEISGARMQPLYGIPGKD